jgi:hypothetical protein
MGLSIEIGASLEKDADMNCKEGLFDQVQKIVLKCSSDEPSSDVNPVKNNETQQRKGTQDRSKDRFEWKNLDPLFMTNKNLGIRKTPQTVVEIPFDKSR